MQGYNPNIHGHHHSVVQYSGSSHDRTSPSGSDDDAGYLVYPEPQRMDSILDDDPNAALTSQTLNPDGTPKRPMNAFMIFARRRRPQVAAENQSMRTGDVSKILSREWNAMSLPDKQFYLDQAKILKDNFNQKYPDYVYKRRPNNSRKRRKPDPSPGVPADQASSSDLVDDYSASSEYRDVSPVEVADMDDYGHDGQDVRYASLPADASGGVYPTAQPRASNYHLPEVPYRSLGDTRPRYTPHPGRTTPDTGVTSSISSVSRGSDHAPSYYHPYPPVQHHHHSHSQPYFPETSSSAQVWTSARDDQSRMEMQSWSHSSQDLGGDNRHRGYPQAVPPQGWATAGGSEGISSSSSSEASTANYGFPTLNSPFYPPQSQPHNSAHEGFSPSSVHPASIPSQQFGGVQSVQGSSVSGRSYSSLQQQYGSGSSSVLGSYQPQARTGSLALSSGQPMSYPHPHLARPPAPAGSGEEPSQAGYWSRQR